MNIGWISGAWFPVFINLCLQSTMVLAAAVLALAVFRRHSAAVRHQMAATAMGLLLLLPILTLLPPVRRGATFHLPQAHIGVQPAPGPARERPARETTPAQSVTTRKLPSAVAAATPVRVEPIRNVAVAPLLTSPYSPPVSTSGIAILTLTVWLSGVTLLALRFACGYVRLFFVARRCSELQDEPLRARISDLLHRTGFHRPVFVVQDTPLTPIDVPITWGARNPVILLPQSAAEWPEGRLRAVLLHEVAHIRRSDWAVQAVAQMACTLFWFHPLAWVVQRCIREEAERACDDAVLLSGVGATEYAGHLLDMVRTVRRGATPAMAVSMAREPQVTTRMRAILDVSRRRNSLDRRAMLSATFLALAFLIPVTWLRPLAAQTIGTPQKVQAHDPGVQSALILSGLLPVTGPGVEVTLLDSRAPRASGSDLSQALIHDHDIGLVVNTLKAAGAEAVSVGDQRLISSTVIRAVGANITINGVNLHAPFVIRAIGNSDSLLNALNAPGGVLDTLRRTDPAMATVTRSAALELPAHTPALERKWSHTVPAPGQGASGDGAAMQYLRALAGMTEVTGPGIRVTLSNSSRGPSGQPRMRDQDILAVIDQMRTAGAEAISVGGQRVVATTAVRAAGGEIRVNDAAIHAPFVLLAIGEPNTLFRALDRRNSAFDNIRRVDLAEVDLVITAPLRLTAYSGSAPRFAHTTTVPAFQQPHEGGPSGQTITFADGTGVELIAVGSSPTGMGDDWWKPDGTPLVEAPVRTNNRFHNSYGGIGTQYLSRTLFFRLHSTADVVASTTGVVVDPTHRLDTDGYHHGRDDRLNDTHLGKQMPASGAVILGFPKSETHCAYRFGIAAGPWETVAVTTMPLNPAARTARPKPASREYNPIIQMNASPVIAYQDGAGKDHLQSLLGGHAPLGDVARRVVAVDRDGREVPMEERGGDYRGDPSIEISADTMARIAEIRLEIRPYQWAEFRDIALQPRHSAVPVPVATPAPLRGLSHTFASGLTVSILGVTERRRDGGRWWRPDGRPVAGPMKEFLSTINFQGFREMDRPRALLIRQTSNRNLNFSEAWQLLPENAAWKGVNDFGGESDLLKNSPFSSFLNVTYPVDVTQCTVRLGIASGPWQTVGRLSMPGDIRHKDVSPDSYEGDLSCALTARPTLEYQSNDGQRKSVPFLASGKALINVAHRIIAIDKMGKTQTLNITMNGMNRSDGSMAPTNYIELSYADSGKLRQYNPIDLASIKEFRLQTRPYEWAEFKGICLNPMP